MRNDRMIDKLTTKTYPGNIINAIGDVRAIAKLTNDNTEAYLKLSQLHYIMGEEEESLK